ncbi:GntR family transcriptional regulator [Escherichia coli]
MQLTHSQARTNDRRNATYLTQPVNQQIYRILRRDIVHCLIAPGTPLSEKEVSVRFNVSRQPVREAFIKLAENGLIQIRPQRGSYVNKISMAQVRNGSFIRQAIECAVARRAASMITESQCYQLEQNLHQQRIAIERKQLDDFFELDDNFHQLLTQIADCQLAWDTIENLKRPLIACVIRVSTTSSPEMLLRQHLDIFSALQKRDGDAVERAMTQHLQEISESVRQIRQEKTATGLAKSNSFPLIPSGVRVFTPALWLMNASKKM